MLILFSGREEAPSLPTLYVMDSLTSEDIAVAGVQGWDDDYIQAQTICNAPMEMQPEVILNEGSLTPYYWCRRLSKVVLRASSDNASDVITIRPLLLDVNDIEILCDDIVISISDHAVDNRYIAPMEIIPIYGAKRVTFKVIDISISSSVGIMVSGV